MDKLELVVYGLFALNSMTIVSLLALYAKHEMLKKIVLKMVEDLEDLDG